MPRACRLLELRWRRDAEFAVERLHAFRPEARNLQEFRDRRGHLPAQFVKRCAMAGGYDFMNLRG